MVGVEERGEIDVGVMVMLGDGHCHTGCQTRPLGGCLRLQP